MDLVKPKVVVASSFSDTLAQFRLAGTSSSSSPGFYGIKGVAASANFPPARYDHGLAIDSRGRVWLYGGYGSTVLNDVWMLAPSPGFWTWFVRSIFGLLVDVW
jgi:hypothetical protein